MSDFGVAVKNAASNGKSIQGSFTFMAPEVYTGAAYDERADIYSLGLILFQVMNRNREPFVNMEKQLVSFQDREEALKHRMAGEAIPDPVNASDKFAEIIGKACAFSVEKRYRSAAELKADLWKLKLGTYTLKNKRKRKKDISFDKKQLIGRTILATLLIVIVALVIPSAVRKGINSFVYRTIDATSTMNGNGLLKTDGTKTIEEISYLDPEIKNRVTEIVFTQEIECIEDDMFADCPNLKRIDLPSSVEQIGEGAFYACTGLETVSIPPSVSTVGVEAFRGCSNLKKVTGGEGIQVIEQKAFYGCEELQEIVLSDTLETIGTYAFYGCKSLKAIDIPERVQCIYTGTFMICEQLKSVTFHEGLKLIGSQAFYACCDLEEISLPDSLVMIDAQAFGNCLQLSKVSISANTTYEKSVFTNDEKLSIQVR